MLSLFVSHRRQQGTMRPVPPYPFEDFPYICGVDREGFAKWYFQWSPMYMKWRRDVSIGSRDAEPLSEAETKRLFCDDCLLSFRMDAESAGTCIRGTL